MGNVPSYDEFLEKKETLSDEECVKFCDEMITHSTLTNIALLVKSSRLIKLKKYDDAILCCKKLIDLSDGKSSGAYVNMSWGLGELGRYEESLESSIKAIDLNPNFSMAWNNKGHALHMMGKSEEALKDVQKALDLDPDNQNAIETKQEILKALGGTG
jgi:tetratricopeptide (TPR) repeat protein